MYALTRPQYLHTINIKNNIYAFEKLQIDSFFKLWSLLWNSTEMISDDQWSVMPQLTIFTIDIIIPKQACTYSRISTSHSRRVYSPLWHISIVKMINKILMWKVLTFPSGLLLAMRDSRVDDVSQLWEAGLPHHMGDPSSLEALRRRSGRHRLDRVFAWRKHTKTFFNNATKF